MLVECTYCEETRCVRPFSGEGGGAHPNRSPCYMVNGDLSEDCATCLCKDHKLLEECDGCSTRL